MTSVATHSYNCIAWAMVYDGQVVWPDEDELFGWPPELERSETLENFILFFRMSGFVECATGDLISGLEKIAIYVKDGFVTHASRLLPSGMWTSKLGPGIDASHTSPQVLADGEYGVVATYMQRSTLTIWPRPALNPPPPLLITTAGLPLKSNRN